MDRPCVIYLTARGRNPIPAIMIGVVQVPLYEYEWMSGQPKLKYSTKALILLQSFSKGLVIEHPWELVEFVANVEEFCKPE